MPLPIYSTMPKNYKQGAVYEIRCKKTGRVYVGSRGTTEKERMVSHRDDLVQYTNTGIMYCSSCLVLESNDFVVNTIESYPCECDVDVCTSVECKRRLNHREGEYIRQYKEEYGELCVNKIIAGRTQGQWITDNIDKVKQQGKERYKQNKDVIDARNRKWYQDNPERKREITRKSMQKNAEKTKQRQSARDICQLCGASSRHDAILRHMRSCFKNSCDSMNLIEI